MADIEKADSCNETENTFRKIDCCLVTSLFLLALLCAFYGIEREGIYHNEPAVLSAAHLDWRELALSLIRPTDLYPDHQPLFFMQLKVWEKIFGSGRTEFRSLSAFWFSLSIALFYILAHTCKLNRLTAFIGALTLIAYPNFLNCSQMISPYTCYLALSLASLILFHRLETSQSKDWTSLCAINFLGVVTFGFFSIIPLYQLVIVLERKEMRQKLDNTFLLGYALLLFAIAVFSVRVFSFRFLWRARHELLNRDFFVHLVTSDGKIQPLAVLILVLSGYQLFRSFRRENLPFTTGLLLLSLLILSLFKYVLRLDEILLRYCIYIFPLIILLAGQAVESLISRLRRPQLPAVFVALLVVTLAFKQINQYHKGSQRFLSFEPAAGFYHNLSQGRALPLYTNDPTLARVYFISLLEALYGESPASIMSFQSPELSGKEYMILYIGESKPPIAIVKEFNLTLFHGWPYPRFAAVGRSAGSSGELNLPPPRMKKTDKGSNK